MDERLYTISLIKARAVPRTKRAPRAIREIRKFVSHHMKTEDVKFDSSINEFIWKRGRSTIPNKLRIKVIKTDDDEVWVYTPEAEVRIPEKKEKKKEKKAAETPSETEEKPVEVAKEQETEEVQEPSEDVPSDAWTKNQLLEYAKAHDIAVTTKMRKADILAAILGTNKEKGTESIEEKTVDEATDNKIEEETQKEKSLGA